MTGLVAIVTGYASGLGRAFAEDLLARGSREANLERTAGAVAVG